MPSHIEPASTVHMSLSEDRSDLQCHRSQVTGHRSQVAGRRPQATDYIQAIESLKSFDKSRPARNSDPQGYQHKTKHMSYNL
jgi:hypothetical protein